MKQYLLIWLEIKKNKILEFIRFNSKLASGILFLIYFAMYLFLRRREDFRALVIAGKMFRHIRFDWSRRFATRILKKYNRKYGAAVVGRNLLGLSNIDEEKVLGLKYSLINKRRPFDKRLIILSLPEEGRKGVMLIKFTEYFRYLPIIFDLDRLGDDYILVIEPSSAGYFDENILCLMQTNAVIIIESPELVDYQFIDSLNANFIPIDVGSNWWVDSRTFYPTRNTFREYDIIMVGLWANVKRHYALFEALSKSKSKGKMRVALVGTPWPKSIDDIRKLARYYKVENCIDFFENIPQQEVNLLLSKSKVFLLLSKKEGFNKALIEAMFADVPGFLLRGFNFGYHYPYINSQTGGFIQPSKLRDFVDDIDNMLQVKKFSPNEWVSRHMSPELAVLKLRELLNKIEGIKQISINKDIQEKINNPDCDYVDQSLWEKYSVHYRNLQRYFR